MTIGLVDNEVDYISHLREAVVVVAGDDAVFVVACADNAVVDEMIVPYLIIFSASI